MKRTKKLSILVVGRGRFGRGLSRALSAAGVEVTMWRGRGPWPRVVPRVDAIVLAVPDPAVRDVAARIARRTRHAERAPITVLHVSGSLGQGAIEPFEGTRIGVMHPLASVAGKISPSFARATFVLDGDSWAISQARRIVDALGARAIVRPIHGPRYHAAAALLANGAAALAANAVEIMIGLGVKRRDAERAIGGLLGTVAENVAALGVPAALTGPIVRGDAETVRRHRAALADAPDALRAYEAIAPIILETARDAGLSAASARAVEVALSSRKSRRRSRRS